MQRKILKSMPVTLVPAVLAVLALSGCVLACRGRETAPPAPSHSEPPGRKLAGAKTDLPSPPSLDETGPRMDLVASQALWHVYRPGLVIPFAGEGWRKYSQEYSNPWREVVRVEGRPGRVLGRTAATLRFPWTKAAGAASLVVRLHGGSCGGKLSLRLNGKLLKNTTLPTGWTEVAADIPPGLLTQGENTMVLAVAKSGGAIHSIELTPGRGAVSGGAWPPSSPAASAMVAGKPCPALTGFPGLLLPIEIPAQGWLRFGTAATTEDAHFQIAAYEEGQAPRILFAADQGAGSEQERSVPLTDLAGKLVGLELAVTARHPESASWIRPRILLPKVKVAPRPQPARNLVVLVADALRADRLPMFATTRVRTPHIAQAAQSMGIAFTATQAASPSSPPSHASIQSGCMPRSHGVLGDQSKVNPGTPTISAILAHAGIATEFVGDANFAMRRLTPVSHWTEFHQPNAEGKGGDCMAVVKEILAFADRHTAQRFFASAVAFEAHTPYLYHEGVTEHYYRGHFDEAIGRKPDGIILNQIVSGKLKMTPERWAQLEGLYDGEVEHLDECVGTLLEGLHARGLAESTPVALLSDHGEGFFEHGSLGHAYGQYAELIHVPLVLFLPGLGHGQHIDTVVSHADLVPTLIDLMGLPADERVQGESLLPMILRDGPWVPRVAASEYGRSYSLRSRRLHYLVDYAGDEHLYDLSLDPSEKTDLKDRQPLALRYFRDLAGIYLAHRANWHTLSWGTLNNHGPGFPAEEVAR
jgi:arylsulfatase A-like enzyme